MKVKCNTQIMAKALQILSSVIPTRSTKPILQNVLFNVGKDIELLGTDLEIALRYRVPAEEIAETGSIALRGDRIASVFREAIGPSMELTADASSCTVTGLQSKYRIMGERADDFPTFPDFPKDGAVDVDKEQFVEMVRKTGFAAAREVRRYALNGVLVSVRDNSLELIATDMKRLAVAKRKVRAPGDTELKAIVPTKGMTQVEKICSDEDKSVGIRFTENAVMFKTKSAELVCRQIEGQFPPYETVVPKDYEVKVECDREELLSVIRRAALMAGEESRAVRMAFADNKLTASSRTAEAGESQVEMPISYAWEKFEIGFNPDFITDVLKVLTEETVVLELKGPTAPAVVRAGQGYTYVVMPLSLV